MADEQAHGRESVIAKRRSQNANNKVKMDSGLRRNDGREWIPAYAGMTEEWIPAFDGMTQNAGRLRRNDDAASPST